MLIGVLAMQGDFKDHAKILDKLNVSSLEVRTKEDLKQVDALIIPGGESTTIGKLLVKYKLDKEIVKRAKKGMPIYGSCAGAILLAKKIESSEQPNLGLADITITRNAYGRQVDSFEDNIKIEGEKKPFNAVFIRAPIVKKTGKNVEILAKQKNDPVLIKENNILISTFHPEMTQDTRIHKLFLKMIKVR